MPKVVISGYYGFHNSGDEAILHAMLLALRNEIPGLEVIVLSKDPDYTAREFGVRAIPRDKPGPVYQAIKESDLLISGGGGLLQDITGPKSIIYYLGIVSMARLLGKPVFLYAQGIGPINTAMGRTLVRLVVNRVNSVTVRDTDSKDELAGLGVTRPSLEVTADPVLGLEPSLIERRKGRDILDSLGMDGRPLVGISVRRWKGGETYKKVIARAADDLVAGGWQALLVPMHCPGDLTACGEVMAQMREKAFLLDHHTDYLSLLSLTANLDLAIGMRLHFLIFSAIFSVPVVSIPYDPKVNRFLQSVGLPPGFSAAKLDYDQLSAGIKNVIEHREQISSALKQQVAPLRAEALKNASLVAELLKSF